MVVPTLPGIGTPSIVIFRTLEWLSVTLVYALLAAAAISSIVLVLLLFLAPLSFSRASKLGKLSTAFSRKGRWLCVHTFPALFKMPKTESDCGSKKFIVFLDRNVDISNGTLLLIAAFCSIVYSVFFTSTIVFLRYFPVEESEECHDKDSHGQSLFCYSNSSNSSLPVDCAEYSVTELRELHFQCYALTISNGLGIAVAAGLALAKVAIAAVTICVKVTEAFFKMTKTSLSEDMTKRPCRGCSSKCANGIYIFSSMALLFLVSVIISPSVLIFLVIYGKTYLMPLQLLYYIAYIILPMLICLPLMYVIYYLNKDNLDKEEGDVESGSSMTPDEASTQGESSNSSGAAPDDTVETLLIPTNGRGNTGYGTTHDQC